MDINSIESKVQDVIGKSAPPALRADGQWQNKSLPQLEIDSLAFAEITFSLEEAFDIEIPLENLDPKMTTMTAGQACRSLAEVIQGLVEAKPRKAA